MEITSTSRINSQLEWDLSLFSNLFVQSECPQFDHDSSFWNSDSLLFHNRRLFISGGSRNGNHLIYSLLDGHPDLPALPGEDVTLTNLFWESLKDHSALRTKLRNPQENASFLSNLSGAYGNKWCNVHRYQDDDIQNIPWSGSTNQNFAARIEFQSTAMPVRYQEYIDKLNSLSAEISASSNIWDVFYWYLKAYSKLTEKPGSNVDKSFSSIYFSSGMRREMQLLASQKNSNFLCIVPIREFNSFAKSKLSGLLSGVSCLQTALNECWEHWRHKTIDFLLLHNRFPGKFIIVKYEDVVQDPYKVMLGLCKALSIPWDPILLVPTQYMTPVIGNSSGRLSENYRGRVYKDSSIGFFDIDLPHEYYSILNYIDTIKVNS